MKKIYTLLAGLFIYFSVSASHEMGGNISYTCIGTNPTILQIDYSIYIDCASPGPSPTLNLTLFNDCGLSNPPVSMSIVDTTRMLPLCLDSLSSCNGGPIQEYVKYSYSAIVTLPDTCDSWTLAFSSCCRPNSTNLSFISDLYYETTINTTDVPCDNSPVVDGQEGAYYCSGITNSYCLPVYDVDGDSLYFELAPNLGGGGSPIPYNVPYSASNPISNVSINNLTGCITFNESTLGLFNVAVRIHSWKNGVYVGYVTHDFPIIIYSCSNGIPLGALANVTGTGASQTGQNTIQACVNEPMCFDVAYIDLNPGDSLTLDTILSDIYQAYPGATATTNGTNPFTVSVCWTPSSLGYYYGTTYVYDDVCPINATGSFTTIINVVVCTPSSIQEENDIQVNVYPNPLSKNNGFDVTIESQKIGSSELMITDLTGRVLINQTISLKSGVNKLSINESLPKGLIILQIKSERQTIIIYQSRTRRDCKCDKRS